MSEWVFYIIVPIVIAITPFTYKGAREFIADRRFLAGVKESPGIKGIPPAGERLTAVESDLATVKETQGEHTKKLDYLMTEFSPNSGKSSYDLLRKMAIKAGVIPDPLDATCDDLPAPK